MAVIKASNCRIQIGAFSALTARGLEIRRDDGLASADLLTISGLPAKFTDEVRNAYVLERTSGGYRDVPLTKVPVMLVVSDNKITMEAYVSAASGGHVELRPTGEITSEKVSDMSFTLEVIGVIDDPVVEPTPEQRAAAVKWFNDPALNSGAITALRRLGLTARQAAAPPAIDPVVERKAAVENERRSRARELKPPARRRITFEDV